MGVGDVDGWQVLTLAGVEHAISNDHVQGFESGVLEFIVQNGGESLFGHVLHSGRDGFRSGPHSPILGMRHDDGSTPGSRLWKIVGMAFRTPLSAKGTIISQITGIVLIDVAQFEFSDSVGLFAALSGRFVELGLNSAQEGEQQD